ncbi:MAG: 4-(cytidine 5'-diphospho)-2-C-methyl-D-erythritol kinase, partial [Plesiomonas shigelloides]
VSTAEVFQHADLPRNTPKLDMHSLKKDHWTNDCQALVCSKYPQVANALSWLLEYAPSRMTGTGSCVFGEFPTQQAALDALTKKPANFQGFIAKGLNRSPLELRLSQL